MWSPDRMKQLRHACIHFGKQSLAFRFTNTRLQIVQEGDKALWRGHRLVFAPERRSDVHANANQLVNT